MQLPYGDHIKNGEEAIENYINALRLGYTKSIGEIYKTAGIKFDFSEEYVNELALFIKRRIKKTTLKLKFNIVKIKKS